MALNQIIGQPVSFNDPSCGNYCMPLVSSAICGDYITNPTFNGNPLDAWTVTKGTQLLEFVIISDGSADISMNQSITLPAGDYYFFYRFNSSNDFTGALTVTNGPTAQQLFDTSGGDNPSGSYAFTVTGSSSRTITLDMDTTVAGRQVGFFSAYICNADAYIPNTSFTFQMPLFGTGSNLLSGTTVSFDNTQDIFTGNDTAQPVNATSPGSGFDSYIMDTSHNTTTIGEDGYYFFKWQLGSVSVTYGQSDTSGISQTILLWYVVDANNEFIPFNVNTTSGGTKTSNSWTMTSGTAVDAYIRAYYEQDSGGTWRIIFDVEDLTTDMTKMWQEDTYTATDDTLYRLKFTNANSTLTTVKVYDSASVLIFDATSDGVKFDKIFNTGTLPVGDKTITVRFEVDNFIEYDSAAYYTDVLTDVSLIEQCQYGVALETLDETTISQLTETHATTTENSSTTSYSPNIEYALDVDSVGSPACYQLRASNDCDAADIEYVSNCFEVCGANCAVGLKQIAWSPGNIKNVGDQILDYENYTGTPWMWVKADIQDLDIQRDVESYTQSDGYTNIPWSRSTNFYTLQIWPIPRFMRVALASAFQNTFTIDGESYQVVDDDAISVIFNARYENPVRITVHKVGEHITSRN